jgi:hypothetical protein
LSLEKESTAVSECSIALCFPFLTRGSATQHESMGSFNVLNRSIVLVENNNRNKKTIMLARIVNKNALKKIS